MVVRYVTSGGGGYVELWEGDLVAELVLAIVVGELLDGVVGQVDVEILIIEVIGGT